MSTPYVTTGIVIALASNPLCVIVDGDRIAMVAANDFQWPKYDDPWPLSRSWVSGNDIRLAEPVRMFGRRELVEKGWDFLEELYEGGRAEYSLALPELRIEESRDWLIRLLFEWRTGAYSYLEVSQYALEALGSSIGEYLLLEGVSTYNVLVDLTLLESEPEDCATYVEVLLRRV